MPSYQFRVHHMSRPTERKEYMSSSDLYVPFSARKDIEQTASFPVYIREIDKISHDRKLPGTSRLVRAQFRCDIQPPDRTCTGGRTGPSVGGIQTRGKAEQIIRAKEKGRNKKGRKIAWSYGQGISMGYGHTGVELTDLAFSIFLDRLWKERLQEVCSSPRMPTTIVPVASTLLLVRLYHYYNIKTEVRPRTAQVSVYWFCGKVHTHVQVYNGIYANMHGWSVPCKLQHGAS
jgi:hypothetical protein